MTPLSVDYCRRARTHLAALGSPLADGARATNEEPATPVVAQQSQKLTPAPAPIAARSEPRGAPQLAAAAAKQAQAEAVPLPPARLAWLGPAESTRAQGGALSHAPEANGSRSGKAEARMLKTEPRVGSAPPRPTDPGPKQVQSARVASREVVTPVERQTGPLPKAQARMASAEPGPGGSLPASISARVAAASPKSQADDRPALATANRATSLGTAQARLVGLVDAPLITQPQLDHRAQEP